MQNDTATLEESLALSYKIKHIRTVQSSNHSPWYLLKGIKNSKQKTCTQLFITALFITAKT